MLKKNRNTSDVSPVVKGSISVEEKLRAEQSVDSDRSLIITIWTHVSCTSLRRSSESLLLSRGVKTSKNIYQKCQRIVDDSIFLLFFVLSHFKIIWILTDEPCMRGLWKYVYSID